jgi:ADP-heptose:LPS heptosyltransferase
MKKNLYNRNAILDFQSGLGNFIHFTPALQYVAKETGRPIRVKFHKDYVRQAFLSEPFLDLENAYSSDPSDYVFYHDYSPKQDVDDYVYLFQEITGKPFNGQEKTYVDIPICHEEKTKPYFVLLNGGAFGQDEYIKPKEMTRKMLESVLFLAQEFNSRIVFLGSNYDYDRTKKEMPDFDDYCHVILNDMRLALSYLHESNGVIANDTGLYHAASAMEKPIIVSDRVPIRSNGLPSRCIRTMNPNTRYVDESMWSRVVMDFFPRFQHSLVDR